MKFFILDLRNSQTDADTEFTEPDDTRTGPAPQCPRCGYYLSLLVWLPPYRVELETWGRRFGDIAGGPGFDLIVSERFRDLYLKEQITGLSAFEPVEIVGLTRHKLFTGDPPRYFKADVILTQATVDDTRSGLIREPGMLCPECHETRGIRKTNSVVLEDDTWKGEDLFRPRGLRGSILASARFKQFCEAHQIANAKLIPAEGYSFDFYKPSSPQV